MVCEAWKTQLDTYVDSELPQEQMSALDTHLRNCVSCASEVLARAQMKHGVHVAGTRHVPSAEFRYQIQQRIRSKPRRGFVGLNWNMLTAVAALLVVVGVTVAYTAQQRTWQGQRVYSELADLHVATLASSSPVDVISTDRHTVKPWFQGRIPFTFDLPELHNSEFSLLGARVTYLGQTPGAHLIYTLRKHEISVFIFPERVVPGDREERSRPVKELSFNVESWSRAGLWYCLIGDVSATDIDNLAQLLNGAGS
jgi:anti-sigma factor RsiW